MSPRVSIIISGVLAVALIGLAVFTIVSVSDLGSEVDELESTTSSLQAETGELKKTATGETATALKDAEASLKQTTAKLKKVEECLPELQNEVNSMVLERFGEEYYVETNSQVSSYCSPVIYNTSGE